MVTIGARVTIDGDDIASSWDGRELVAVSDLVIRWGRDDPYADTEPASFAMQLIDPTGGWAADTARIGQTIIVRRTDNDRIMFRGRIATLTSDLRRVHNPRYMRDTQVWIVGITATDVLGELAMARVAGPASATDREGLGGWNEQRAESRGQTLWDRGINAYLSSMWQFPFDLVPEVRIRMRGVTSDRKLSLLDHLAALYRCAALGYVRYDPHTNGVQPGTWAAQTPIVLQVVGGVVVINMPGALRVPASQVITPDGYGLAATVADAIDYAQVHYTAYVPDPDWQPTSTYHRGTFDSPIAEAATDHAATSTGRRVAVVDSEIITRSTELFDPSLWELMEKENAYPAYLASEIVPIVNGFNEQMRLPTIRLDFDRINYGAATDALLNPIAQAVPISFPGSVFNRFWNVGPQFQIIGGTLRYDDGWTHDVHLVAAAPTGTPIRINQIAVTNNATYNDFDESVTLTELGTVTQGLA